MVILGIETSCDETAASVVENGTKVLSHVLASSADVHAKTGGIIPETAAREQVKSIIPVIETAINDSGLTIKDIDTLAVTVGPGLLGSLLVGVETAKTLSLIWSKPIVPVNHLIGHIYANWLAEKYESPTFPALALVVSGGHTDLVMIQDHSKIRWIGGTRDDAAGEAFDKTARLLGMKYPGGPAIAKAAEQYRKQKTASTKLSLFPRPLLDKNNFDWSFSGLKTAVSREVQKVGKLTKGQKAKFAAEIQEAIVEVLIEKTMHAVKKFKPKSLLLGGGVASNRRLRQKFEIEIKHLALGTRLRIAPPKFCTDNASMIAAAAYHNYKEVPWRDITAVPQLSIIGEI